MLSLPFQVELEVLKDGSARQEGTAEARQDLPAVQVAHTARVGHLIGLLDELAVHFIPQRPQVVPRLQDALDDGDGVGHGLQLLERIEYLDSFILEGCVAFVFEHWKKGNQQPSLKRLEERTKKEGVMGGGGKQPLLVRCPPYSPCVRIS